MYMMVSHCGLAEAKSEANLSSLGRD